MKILCIIPCYNAEGTLKAAIESIIQQSYTNWELVIVDDASIDKSYKIARSYAKKHPNITVLKNHTNQGCYYSRNRALYHMKDKEWDVFTVHNANDTSTHNRFQINIDIFNTNPKLSVIKGISSGKKRNVSDIFYSVKKSTPAYLFLNIEYQYKTKYIKDMHNPEISFFKRDIFKILGYFDNTRFAGSVEYHERILQYLFRISPEETTFENYKDQIVRVLARSRAYTYITGPPQTPENLVENTFEKQMYSTFYKNKIGSYKNPYEFYYNFIP